MKLIDKILSKELKLHLWGLAFVLALILTGVGFEALAPLPFKILIDNVLGTETAGPGSWLGRLLAFFPSRESLGFFVVLAFCVASLVVTITDYFVSRSVKRLARDMVRDFSRKAFDNLEKLAVGYYKKQEIGDYIYRLSYDVSALGEWLESGLVPTITHSLYLVSTAVIIYLIHPKLALLALVMLPILAGSLRIFNRRIGTASEQSERSNSALFSFIEEVLGQLKIIQAFNQQKRESGVFGSKEESSLTRELDVYGLDYLLNLLIGLVIAVGYAIVIAYGIRLAFLGEISTGLLIVFIFYLDNLTGPLLSLMNAAAVLKETHVKIARMENFFTHKFHTRDTGRLTVPENTDIVFEGVSVFGDERTPILQDISCAIPDNHITAVVGISGSGKTTLASLILRFIEPHRGRILLGGKDVKRYAMQNLREAIAYVPQEITLFNDSIAANIAFGHPHAALADIRRAAKIAVADEFIRRLPGGYGFHVGEEGMNLSGGQRQRLMLARAFVKRDAQILILDEPLSSLDVQTRAVLMQRLKVFAKGKTTIIISNLLEVLQDADRVLVVNNGRLIHQGPSSEFLKKTKLSSLLLETL